MPGPTARGDDVVFDGRTLIIEITRLHFCASAGLGVLLDASEQTRHNTANSTS